MNTTAKTNADGAPRYTADTPGAERGLGAASTHASTPHARGNDMGRPTAWIVAAVALVIIAAIGAFAMSGDPAEVLDPEPVRGQQALTPDVP